MVKDDEKKEEEAPCDPLIEECDVVKDNVLSLAKESATLDSGIEQMEKAVRELDEAAKIFEDETGGDAFKEEKERLREKIEEAKKMKEECDDQCYDGVKKYNVCRKSPKK
jgi:hypothetical protein